jgi:hypothetical protein
MYLLDSQKKELISELSSSSASHTHQKLDVKSGCAGKVSKSHNLILKGF